MQCLFHRQVPVPRSRGKHAAASLLKQASGLEVAQASRHVKDTAKSQPEMT